ncbi:Tetratricopeptide repeat protein 27 [Geodia barretti]|uniref:Tetratricopeptide repeat protein 27 n=1 Tax=Geodia barretti TaxID=519541 RepID=A0AA35TRH5_GEOBA|nr:Tetratricopeptide repeat protein 27 [Geodia barretti]
MVPKNVQLQDDTLLDSVVYSDPETTPTPRLTSLEQAVVLGQCVYRLRSLPIDRLGYEEAEAFIQCVLSQPLCWCVQSVALFLRCQSERRRSKRAERAMLQLEELTQSYSASKDDHVLDLFYCLPVPTIWAIEKEYADVLLSVGATKSALEVYERLEMWEEVAECSSAVGRTGRVREVVTERLERGAATPTLLCVLGDVTRDPEDYRRAWHMSEGRCGRAQRSLGYYHLRRKEYKECIPAFQLSLKINSLQEKVWFSLGCAAQQVGDQELAVQAFQRCVSLEADFSEAWNNLATIYLRRKEKVKAFRAFQEAVKCNYDSWKIWENLLVVSVEIGELRQALQAYHRILDLQNKFLDVEVSISLSRSLLYLYDALNFDLLSFGATYDSMCSYAEQILRCMVRAVLDGQEDRSGQSAGRLRDSVGQLLGRVTSQVTGNSDVWELYADYHCSSSDTLDQEKGLLELQKAQRCARQVRGWDRQWTGLERAAHLTLKYCHKCRELSQVREDGSQSVQSLSSAKLALQGIITKTKVPSSLSLSSLFLSLVFLLSKWFTHLLLTLTGIWYRGDRRARGTDC